MSKPSIAVVIPTYNGVNRLRFMLETVRQNDPKAFEVEWLIVEDPCGYDGVSVGYRKIADDYPVEVHFLHEWSNMHGAAKKAFELAFDRFNPDWVIYLGDDLAVTPGALSNLIYFIQENPLETVSLIQPGYFNAHDLCKSEDGEWQPYLKEQGYALPFWVKEDFYKKGMEWTKAVPRNPHWEGEGIARSYVNVNGVGFAVRASTYREVGGFAEKTWCLDESISVRTWINSTQSIVCLPGPPLIHFFGGSTIAQPKPHDRHTHEAWVEAMGMTKEEAGALSYKAMHEREDAVKEEMARCKYFGK